MRYSLRLESIGDDMRIVVKPPWCAELTGLDPRYGLARRFLSGKRDYREANSVGSRGVYLYYLLDDGLYEVFERLTWGRSERYFLRVQNGQAERIEREEVEQCLRASEASASMS